MCTLRDAVRHSLHSGSMSSSLLSLLLLAPVGAAIATADRVLIAAVAAGGRILQPYDRTMPRPSDAVIATAVDAVLQPNTAAAPADQCCTACMCGALNRGCCRVASDCTSSSSKTHELGCMVSRCPWRPVASHILVKTGKPASIVAQRQESLSRLATYDMSFARATAALSGFMDTNCEFC